MKIKLGEVRHNLLGFQALVALCASTSACFLEDVEIDMSHCGWFDADMSAGFGALLYKLGADLNSPIITNLPNSVETILSKNGFLSTYGRQKLRDKWGTTIPYRRFDAKDDKSFAEYIEREFMKRTEIPSMSKGLRKKFRESVFEIFSNAVIHSKTELGIFSCGQFFPNKHSIDFSVADLGIGIKKNVCDNTSLDLTAEKAIVWATEASNTTKRGPIPGGLGLKLLKEFINLNGGRIQIVSDAGYWCFSRGKTEVRPLAHAFPGTIVNIEINTADKKSYILTSEQNEADIF
jgi:hypothetical protein